MYGFMWYEFDVSARSGLRPRCLAVHGACSAVSLGFLSTWLFVGEGGKEMFVIGWLLLGDEDSIGPAHFPAHRIRFHISGFPNNSSSAMQISNLASMGSALLDELIERGIGLSVSEEVSECFCFYSYLLDGVIFVLFLYCGCLPRFVLPLDTVYGGCVFNVLLSSMVHTFSG